jgi:regulator of replication initiation timing
MERMLLNMIPTDTGEIDQLRRQVADLSQQLQATEREKAEVLIENGRLRGELVETREQQTATADVLQVISTSPADLDPVLQAIVERGCRLLGADTATIRLVDGNMLRVAANYWGAAYPEDTKQYWQQRTLAIGASRPIDAPGYNARAFARRRHVHCSRKW